MEGANLTTTVFDNYVDMRNAFAELKNKVETQGKKLEDQGNTLNEQRNTIGILDQERKINKIAMDKFEKEAAVLKNETIRLNNEIEQLRVKYEHSQFKITELEACNEKEREKNKRLAEELLSANQEKEQKIAENLRLQNENGRLDREKEGLKEENEGLKKVNNKQNESNNTLVEKNNLAEEKNKTLTELNINLSELNKDLNAKIECFLINAVTLQNELSEKEIKIQERDTQISKINKENKEKKEEMEKLAKKINELEEKILQKEIENQKLKSAQTKFLSVLTEKEFGNKIEDLLWEMKNTKEETAYLNTQLNNLNQDEDFKRKFLEILDIKPESQKDFKEWVNNYVEMINSKKADEGETNNLETDLSKLLNNQGFLDRFLEIIESKNNNPEVFKKWLSSYAKMIEGEKEIKKHAEEFKKLNLNRKFHDKFLEILNIQVGDINKFNEWVQSIIDILEIQDPQKEIIKGLLQKIDSNKVEFSEMSWKQSVFNKAISLFNYIKAYLPT